MESYETIKSGFIHPISPKERVSDLEKRIEDMIDGKRAITGQASITELEYELKSLEEELVTLPKYLQKLMEPQLISITKKLPAAAKTATLELAETSLSKFSPHSNRHTIRYYIDLAEAHGNNVKSLRARLGSLVESAAIRALP